MKKKPSSAAKSNSTYSKRFESTQKFSEQDKSRKSTYKMKRKDSKASFSSMNNSKYDQMEDNARPLESYKRMIKAKMPEPSPLEQTFENFDERLQDNSSIYSPLQKRRGDTEEERQSTLRGNVMGVEDFNSGSTSNERHQQVALRKATRKEHFNIRSGDGSFALDESYQSRISSKSRRIKGKKTEKSKSKEKSRS